jgi:hypothetical protein
MRYLYACRLCHKDARYYEAVKYGVRHYAHFACYLDHKKLADLPKWRIESFPWRLIAERGLEAEFDRLTCEAV